MSERRAAYRQGADVLTLDVAGLDPGMPYSPSQDCLKCRSHV